jgi:hypothetical protein
METPTTMQPRPLWLREPLVRVVRAGLRRSHTKERIEGERSTRVLRSHKPCRASDPTVSLRWFQELADKYPESTVKACARSCARSVRKLPNNCFATIPTKTTTCGTVSS